MSLLEWCTVDHCGGVLYGPYTRKHAFDIQKQMRSEHDCDRQDVVLCTSFNIFGKMQGHRLITFKCKGEQK